MNRSTAENLLALLIFDELDEPTKTELLAYLQTDAELSQRLDDMRRSVDLLQLASQATPSPTLDAAHRRKLLHAATRHRPTIVFSFRHAAAIAAIVLLMIGVAGTFFLPSLGRARQLAHSAVAQSDQPTDSFWKSEQNEALSHALPSPPPASAPAPAEESAAYFGRSGRESNLRRDKDGDVSLPSSGSGGGVYGLSGHTQPTSRADDLFTKKEATKGAAPKRGAETLDRISGEKLRRFEGVADGKSVGAGDLVDHLESREKSAIHGPAVTATGGVAYEPRLQITGADKAGKQWAVESTPTAANDRDSQSNKKLSESAPGSSRVPGSSSTPAAPSEPSTPGNPGRPKLDVINGTPQRVLLSNDIFDESRRREGQSITTAPVAGLLDSPGSSNFGGSVSSDAGVAGAVTLGRLGAEKNGQITSDTSSMTRSINRARPDSPDRRKADGAQKDTEEAIRPSGPEIQTYSVRGSLQNAPKDAELGTRSSGPEIPTFEQAPTFDLAIVASDSDGTVHGIFQDSQKPADAPAKMREQLKSADSLSLSQTEAAAAPTQTQPTAAPAAPSPVTAPTFAPDLSKNLEDTAITAVTTEYRAALPPASQFVDVPLNPWVLADSDRFSTFGLDTDTASYTLARRYLLAGFRPPSASVRMEEFINAFDYNYPNQSERTFVIHADAAPAGPLIPAWSANGDTLLLKIGVKAKTLGREGRKPAHLVFVIDASGSMAQPDRLPLVQYALTQLVDHLDARDRITVIAYRTEAELLIEDAGLDQRDAILQSINNIQPRASTNLLAGLETAYQLAARHFVAGQINRIIICSDGAANIGETDAKAMLDRVDSYRKQGVTLTAAGFGFGNFNDQLLSTLAKQGDGNYVFIDSRKQADETFVANLASTLQTVAKDAKIQVEFDPAVVRRYRLIGYERRDIADKDFRNDAIDAGEVGSGQSATALYQVELADRHSASLDRNLGTVYVRYRNFDTNAVEEISTALDPSIVRQRTVAEDPRFYLATCAGQFAEILRNSPYAETGNLPGVLRVINEVAAALPLDQKVAELRQLIQQSLDKPVAP